MKIDAKTAVSDADKKKINDLPTKSAKIRALAAKGYARARIAEALRIRYQHVRNVLEDDKLKADK